MWSRTRRLGFYWITILIKFVWLFKLGLVHHISLFLVFIASRSLITRWSVVSGSASSVSVIVIISERKRNAKSFYTFLNDKILAWFKLKATTDDKSHVPKIMIFVFHSIVNNEKRRKCWLLAFSPFPQCLQKASPWGC